MVLVISRVDPVFRVGVGDPAGVVPDPTFEKYFAISGSGSGQVFECRIWIRFFLPIVSGSDLQVFPGSNST